MNPFVNKEYAGKKVRFDTFAPHEAKGPPFKPYNLRVKNEHTAKSYVTAEYDHGGRLITLTRFNEGIKIFTQTIIYEGDLKRRVIIENSQGHITHDFELND